MIKRFEIEVVFTKIVMNKNETLIFIKKGKVR